MKAKLLFSIVILGLVSVASALAADISGKWTVEQEGRNGGPARVTTFMFKQAGGAVTGTVAAPGRGGAEPMPVELKNGKVEGDMVTFSLTTEGRNGQMTRNYSGKIAGDEITFTVAMEGGQGGGGGRGPQGPMVAKRAK